MKRVVFFSFLKYAPNVDGLRKVPEMKIFFVQFIYYSRLEGVDQVKKVEVNEGIFLDTVNNNAADDCCFMDGWWKLFWGMTLILLVFEKTIPVGVALYSWEIMTW